VGTVIIHPDEPEFLPLIGRELLALADSPYQVEYVMWPKPGFRVPEELFDRWEALGSDTVPESSQTLEPETAETSEPVKRKPGRPRKNTEGQ
jgi:hypothetical protein